MARRSDLHLPGDADPRSRLPQTDRRHWRRAYLLGNAFEAAIAFATVVAGIVFFADPAQLSDSAIGRQAGALQGVWSVMYFAGGLGVLVGLARPSPRLEVAGLSLFIAAVTTNGVAIGTLAPGRVSSSLTFIAFGAAAVARIYLVWRLTLTIRRVRELR